VCQNSAVSHVRHILGKCCYNSVMVDLCVSMFFPFFTFFPTAHYVHVFLWAMLPDLK